MDDTSTWGALAAGAVAVAALLAIWLGYPAVRWCRARWRPRPIRPDPQGGARRSVAVILATRASPQAVVARVENLLDTAHPRDLLSVVVAVDGDPAPVRAALAGGGAVVTVVAADAPGGKACAVNAGVRAARAEVLVFADTAQRFDRHTIPELLAALEDPDFGAISGTLVLPADASPLRAYWALERFLRRQEMLVHSSIGVTGAVYAMRAAQWAPLPAGTILDDVYVPMRLVLDGWRVGVVPAARAWDSRSFDAGAEVTRKTRTQTGVLQLLQLLPALRTRANPVRRAFYLHKLARLTSPLWVLLLLGAMAALLATGLAQAGPTALAAGAALLCAFLLWPAGRRRVRDALTFGVALQWALGRAVVFGSAGRWAVWDAAAHRAVSPEAAPGEPPVSGPRR
jgi:cellulose synthase/poly-beta-1,6-N-acetylglucosamine synthase-like glycosyltransferase